MKQPTGSKRARSWMGHDPYLVRTHFLCARDPYDPEHNLSGYVNFGTAENQEIFGAIEPLLEASVRIVEQDSHYGPLHGAQDLREAIVEFLHPRAGRRLSADHLALASGASAVLEILAFVLCDPGDGILIPTPYYPGFDHDLGLRSGARLVHVPLRGPHFALTAEAIERALVAATNRGVRISVLLLNSPHNPLGRVYDESLVRQLVGVAERHGIHVILDEIYAESLLPGARHFSGLRIQSPWVHVVYGVAKDFGLSGYKLGILHSESPEIIAAAQASAYFHAVSALTQRALTGLLRSPELPEFLATMRRRLAESHREAIETLSQAGISCMTSQGGIVLWMDLRAFLREASFVAERELAEDLITSSRVNISPGFAFHCDEPGWFRLCFTVPREHRREGLRRLIQAVNAT